jgi:stage IV sporulation protein FB
MMHLGTIRGTTIGVDGSFLILVALFVVSNYNANQGLRYALLWIPVVFISVLVHELAHAAAIALFGYGPSTIVLGGMGGVTINRRQAKPWQDVVISIAGPLTSIVLAFVLVILYFRITFLHTDPMMVALMPLLVWANRAWGIFNLLPVSPLDGGHAVRSFLRIFLRDPAAFHVSVWIAFVAGAAAVAYFVLIGLFFAALLIGWYVFMNYQQWRHFREHGTPGD